MGMGVISGQYGCFLLFTLKYPTPLSYIWKKHYETYSSFTSILVNPIYFSFRFTFEQKNVPFENYIL